METPIVGAVCTNCGARFDAATSVTASAIPSTGDASICIRCGQVDVFVVSGFGYSLRPPTADELAAFKADPEISMAMTFVLMAIARG